MPKRNAALARSLERPRHQDDIEKQDVNKVALHGLVSYGGPYFPRGG